MNTSKKIMIVLGVMILVLLVMLMITGKDEEPASPQNFVSEVSEPWTMYEPLDKQLELVERVQKSWFGDPIDIMATKYGKYVICDWFMYKSYVASNNESYKKALEQFNADSMDLVGTSGIQGNFWASVVAFEMFLGALSDEGERAKIYETCRPITPDLEKYFQNEIAVFLNLAATESMLDENGKVREDQKRLAKLLYRKLWVKASDLQYPHRALVSPEEEMAVFRWQIEASHMSPEAKLNKISEMQKMYPKSYDYEYAQAMTLYQGGNVAGACEKLNALLNAGPDETRRNRYKGALKTLRDLDAARCP